MAEARGPVHPLAFLALYLPFGASSGFITVTLAYLLHQRGVSVPAFAGLVALNLLPNTWKVLWSPLVDTTLSARRWYVIGIGITAATFLIFAFAPLGPSSLTLLSVLTFGQGAASTISAMATDRFMAFDTREDEKGRAGAWSQAGNVGGSGLGGGLALLVAKHTGQAWTGGALLAALSLACLVLAFRLKDPPRVDQGRGYLHALKDTGRDVVSLATGRMGLLALFICLLPFGTGAASNLWSATAGDWHAGADEIALVGGLLNGVVSLVGALAAGLVCDRMDRKAAYAMFGVFAALAAFAMALGPRTPVSFMSFASAYNLMVGACYGAFGALTLEAIGQGAAATKYNLIASVSNLPIMWMTLIDGQAQKRWGSGGMLYAEAAFAVGAAVLYAGVVFATRGWSWRGARRLMGLGRADETSRLS